MKLSVKWKWMGVAVLAVMLSACGGAAAPTQAPTTAAQPTSAPTEVPTESPTEASPATATATATAEATIAPTETAAPDSETPIPVEPAGVLPAPLYYVAPVDGIDQIWRLGFEGAGPMPVTSEITHVIDFDVSPADGSLAYVSQNSLIKVDANGGGRAVLVEGPELPAPLDETFILKQLTRPRWSPDGARIAYGLSGINLIDANGGQPTAALPNDPLPTPGQELTGPVMLYQPETWSPDGAKMIVLIGYYGSEGGYGVFDLAAGKATSISSPEGLVCCNPSWATDSASVYFANPLPGMIGPGLWRTDVASAETTTLITGTVDNTTWRLVGYPHQAADGALYYFYAETNPEPMDYQASMGLYRAEADGLTGQTKLRDVGFVPGEALWAPDGSGVLVTDVRAASQAGQYPLSGPAIYLKADGSPEVQLVDNARLLRWGK